MASLDTRRPAAQEQLKQLGEQTGVATLPIINWPAARRHCRARRAGGKKLGAMTWSSSTPPAAPISDRAPLMAELAEIKKRTNPHEILLVADALTGQDAVNLARSFDERVGITGLVLTRMDGRTAAAVAAALDARCYRQADQADPGTERGKYGRARGVPSPPRSPTVILGMGRHSSAVE